MSEQWWSWALTLVGVACFWLAGRKVWWAWYVGLAGQVTWLAYSLMTEQWGFLVGVVLYTFVYTRNAVRWTREKFPHAHSTDPRADPDWYDSHCPTCDAPEPSHTPTCAVVHSSTDPCVTCGWAGKQCSSEPQRPALPCDRLLPRSSDQS